MKRATFDISGETHFMNVDLDVFSSRPLDPLAAAFGKRVIVLYVGGERRRYRAHFEVRESFKRNADADKFVRRFVELIRGLPPGARRLWNGASKRDFNIGIQSASKPHSHELRLAADTLKQVAAVGGSIVVTTYAPET
jgi:hypothetical protein